MTTRPRDYRIEPVDPEEPENQAILATTFMRDGRPLNIFGVLAHHPRLLDRFNRFGGFILDKGLVPARERELVILRVGWNARARYEFGQHTLVGAEAGVTQEEIHALTRPIDAYHWSGHDRALLALADELHDDDCITESTWAQLCERWNEAELIELVVVAGFYRLVSGFLNSTGVQLEDGVPGFPAHDTSPGDQR
ncbi:MAG: carboxymuconolactone decarboxylase family protein [Acidimicrobiia bacterium]|nr:carboxymuconolactone decarboxylase family protein [Acidimicrobiia bacterium]